MPCALAELRRAVLVEELDGLIFLNPDRYNENNPDIGWETADEYLSGMKLVSLFLGLITQLRIGLHIIV